jgi:hypothetical protein
MQVRLLDDWHQNTVVLAKEKFNKKSKKEQQEELKKKEEAEKQKNQTYEYKTFKAGASYRGNFYIFENEKFEKIPLRILG